MLCKLKGDQDSTEGSVLHIDCIQSAYMCYAYQFHLSHLSGPQRTHLRTEESLHALLLP